MRITIVSDVHSNDVALRSVLRHAEAHHGLDALWSLGDLVGYGPQPNEVIAALQQHQLSSVMGNHDLAATGGMDTSEFNEAAAIANKWNAAQMTVASASFLRGQQTVLMLPISDMVICHGSLREPIWEYLITEEAAIEQFDRMTVPYSFVGHTHIPLVIEQTFRRKKLRARQPENGTRIKLGRSRLILNPGSVGQPRDGDPRAAYAILDTDERAVEFFRVPYAIEETQQMMSDAGLPPRLIMRLSAGH